MVGWPEILFIMLFVLILFGAKKIPEVARTLGKVIFDLKKAADDIKQEITQQTEELKKDITAQTDEIKKDLTGDFTKIKDDLKG